MKIEQTIKDKEVEREKDGVKLDLELPAQSEYFDGHFDGFPILPGVVQIQLVQKYAEKYFDIQFPITQISHLKFIKPIFPSQIIQLSLQNFNDERITFEITRDFILCAKGILKK